MDIAKSGASHQQLKVNEFLADGKFNLFHGLLIFVGFLTVLADGYDLYIYGATVPLLLKEFNMSPAQAGVIGSYALIGAAIGAVGFGYLADKIGQKWAIVVGTTIFAVATFCTGFTHDPNTFGLARFIAGLGVGGSAPCFIALASQYAPARNRTLCTAIIMAGMAAGGIVSAGLSMWLVPSFGWRSVYFVASSQLLLLPLTILFVPESPLHLLRRKQVDKLRKVLQRARPQDPVPADAELVYYRGGGGKVPIVELFKESRAGATLCMWTIYFFSFYLVYALGTWLPKLMMEFGFSLSSGLWFLASLNIGKFISAFGAGWVADRVGRRKTACVLFLTTFVTLALLAFTRDFAVLSCLIALAGVGNGAGQGVIHAHNSLYYPPTMRATALGCAMGIGRIGGFAGPAINGVLMMFTSNVNVLFFFLGLPGLVVGILIWLVRDKHNFTPDQAQLAPAVGAPSGAR